MTSLPSCVVPHLFASPPKPPSLQLTTSRRFRRQISVKTPVLARLVVFDGRRINKFLLRVTHRLAGLGTYCGEVCYVVFSSHLFRRQEWAHKLSPKQLTLLPSVMFRQPPNPLQAGIEGSRTAEVCRLMTSRLAPSRSKRPLRPRHRHPHPERLKKVRENRNMPPTPTEKLVASISIEKETRWTLGGCSLDGA